MLGLDPQAGVEKVALVGDLTLRSGLEYRRGGEHPHAVTAQRFARRPQARPPVALVRAEAEVAGQASFQTSTDTSSTGSGIGGSGLVAFTRTDSAPSRSMSRSATALHSRSSVL